MKSKEDKSTITQSIFDFDLSSGAGLICGVDEAGRGPLAGPVVCAAVVMPYDTPPIIGIYDSKKVSEKERERLYLAITQAAICYKIATIDNHTIDQINILEATRRGMEQAILSLATRPDVILVDAVKGLKIDRAYSAIISGDQKSYAIAAASILAKVTRDNLMKAESLVYPQYGFDSNKGYGTKSHIEAFRKFGKTPIHRTTFVKNLGEVE